MQARTSLPSASDTSSGTQRARAVLTRKVSLASSATSQPAALPCPNGSPKQSTAHGQTAPPSLPQKNSPQLKELRTLLAATVPLQAEFAAQRSTASLPKILAAAPPDERNAIRARFLALTQTGSGLYCLMDYVNFKGEGTNPAERYKGHGWGLLQVLQAIPGQPSPQQAPAAFAAAAKRTLGRRIELAPKKESQWREGWFNRCDSYARGL